MEKKQEEPEKEKPKPFKLCFVNKHVLGQSNIKIGNILGISPIVTPKFYQNNKKQDENNEELIKKYLVQLEEKGPKQKYPKPATENQTYGWYSDVKLTDTKRSDRRLNFHKNTNVIVKEHLMNYAKIRS